MKRYIAILLFVVALPVAAAAQMRTSYFMEGSTFRTDMNPALAPTRGYISFPALGGLGVDVNSNFLSIQNMLYPTDDGLALFMHRDVDRNDFLKRLPRNNNLGISLSEQIFGVGHHTKRLFWSVGMNMKMNVDVNIPKSFFSLLTNLSQGSYSMQNMKLGVNAYMELYAGVAVPVNDFITVGGRLKGLWGMANASLDVTNTTVNINDEKVDAQLAAQMVGCVPMLREVVTPEGEIDLERFGQNGIDMRGLFQHMANVGVAVDLGAEVRLLDDNLRLSAAVTDLGFISWNKQSSLRGSVTGGMAYEGLVVRDITEGFEMNITQKELNIKVDDSNKGYTQRLNCQLNVGAEYAILDNRISFGLLSHTQFCSTFALSELTASVNFKPLNWISASVSHTFLNRNRPGVFGCALNFHPAGLNLFIGADFIDLKFASMTNSNGGRTLLPMRQRSTNLYFGFGFSLGRAKYSKAYKEDLAAGRIKSKPAKR